MGISHASLSGKQDKKVRISAIRQTVPEFPDFEDITEIEPFEIHQNSRGSLNSLLFPETSALFRNGAPENAGSGPDATNAVADTENENDHNGADSVNGANDHDVSVQAELVRDVFTRLNTSGDTTHETQASSESISASNFRRRFMSWLRVHPRAARTYNVFQSSSNDPLNTVLRSGRAAQLRRRAAIRRSVDRTRESRGRTTVSAREPSMFRLQQPFRLLGRHGRSSDDAVAPDVLATQESAREVGQESVQEIIREIAQESARDDTPAAAVASDDAQDDAQAESPVLNETNDSGNARIRFAEAPITEPLTRQEPRQETQEPIHGILRSSRSNSVSFSPGSPGQTSINTYNNAMASEASADTAVESDSESESDPESELNGDNSEPSTYQTTLENTLRNSAVDPESNTSQILRSRSNSRSTSRSRSRFNSPPPNSLSPPQTRSQSPNSEGLDANEMDYESIGPSDDEDIERSVRNLEDSEVWDSLNPTMRLIYKIEWRLERLHSEFSLSGRLDTQFLESLFTAYYLYLARSDDNDWHRERQRGLLVCLLWVVLALMDLDSGYADSESSDSEMSSSELEDSEPEDTEMDETESRLVEEARSGTAAFTDEFSVELPAASRRRRAVLHMFKRLLTDEEKRSPWFARSRRAFDADSARRSYMMLRARYSLNTLDPTSGTSPAWSERMPFARSLNALSHNALSFDLANACDLEVSAAVNYNRMNFEHAGVNPQSIFNVDSNPCGLNINEYTLEKVRFFAQRARDKKRRMNKRKKDQKREATKKRKVGFA